jgi:hypothetical protein
MKLWSSEGIEEMTMMRERRVGILKRRMDGWIEDDGMDVQYKDEIAGDIIVWVSRYLEVHESMCMCLG